MANIDLEEANRIRVAMGLKPIETGPTFKEASDQPGEEAASTLETRSALAEDNYRKALEEDASKARRKAQREAIKKAKDNAMRSVRMTGKTLGNDEEELDTASWLRQQNKRQKKIEKQRAIEEEEKKKEKQAEYTAQDLAGVKVGHEFGQFEGGEEQILTLKDAVIGEESEDDELENQEMKEQERLKDKLELKKRKPIYNPNDDDEAAPGEKKMLAHYDEEIDRKKQHKFTLDGLGNTKERIEMEAEDAKAKSKGLVISLDELRDDKPISDYQEAKEIKIRKPKKKKSKSTRKKNLDDDDIFNGNTTMEVDETAQNGVSSKKRSHGDANFEDDDDMQFKLAQQRRDALKRKKRIRPEDLARQLREEEANAMDGVEDQGEEAPGLVFDETSEFVNHLEALEEREEEIQPRIRSKSVKSPGSDSEDDVEMEEADSKVRFEGLPDPIEQTEQKDKAALEEESTIENGIGSTLSMLRQRRHLDESKHGDAQTFRSYESFLTKKRAREDDAEREARRQREKDRQTDYYRNMSAKDREDLARKHNNQREQQESRAVADMYNKEYKPNVELKYIDEFGRSMNQKEAFKHLSHQFHGKGSGKQKHEKRLKKIDEEKKRESMAALDSSQHVSSVAMGSKAKKNQQAGVRLQ